MYCSNCGFKLDGGKYCGGCGCRVNNNNNNTQIIYKEEEEMKSLLNDTAIVALTLCVLILSIITIVCASVITKDIEDNRLCGTIDVNYKID